jgi:hypothetical protein
MCFWSRLWFVKKQSREDSCHRSHEPATKHDLQQTEDRLLLAINTAFDERLGPALKKLDKASDSLEQSVNKAKSS